MIIMNKFAEINMVKNEIVDSILPLLDDLRNGSKKGVKVNNICKSFLVVENAEIECVKIALNEICSSNPDILGRVDVFDTWGTGLNITDDGLDIEQIKGVTITLFLDKDKSILDHPDIDRFYSQCPVYYTGKFDDESNKFFGALFDSILAVKEKRTLFSYLKSSISEDQIEIISKAAGRVEEEGLEYKVKVAKRKTSNDMKDVYFFIYKTTECEKMIKQVEPLERRSSFRLVK